jgi:hypothetical protein
MFFTKKNHHRPLESNKNSFNHPFGLKICILRLNRAFKIAIKLENRRGSFLPARFSPKTALNMDYLKRTLKIFSRKSF